MLCPTKLITTTQNSKHSTSTSSSPQFLGKRALSAETRRCLATIGGPIVSHRPDEWEGYFVFQANPTNSATKTAPITSQTNPHI
jgi:hypothetical protein